MKINRKTMFFCVYIAGFVLTFGHHMAKSDRTYRQFNGTLHPQPASQQASEAMLCAFAWPLYLSHYAFDLHNREKKNQ